MVEVLPLPAAGCMYTPCFALQLVNRQGSCQQLLAAVHWLLCIAVAVSSDTFMMGWFAHTLLSLKQLLVIQEGAHFMHPVRCELPSLMCTNTA